MWEEMTSKEILMNDFVIMNIPQNHYSLYYKIKENKQHAGHVIPTGNRKHDNLVKHVTDRGT